MLLESFKTIEVFKLLKKNNSVNQDFYFSNTEVRDIFKETTALNNKKNGTFCNIPAKRLKERRV